MTRPEPPQRPLDAFGVDIRSLALLRIAYALLILIDLATRARDLSAHYSDDGVLPRTAMIELSGNVHWVSVHMMGGSAYFEAFLFLLNAFFALALLVGWRTRWATFLCWFFLISLHSRNPMVLNGGDIYLRCIMFWANFLPWEACWSVDSVQNPGLEKVPLRLTTAATCGYLVQVGLVYWFAAIPKTDPTWTVDYSAAYYALMLDQFTKPFGHLMLEFPRALSGLTFAVWWFEALGPFLLMAPFGRGPLRMVGILGLAGMHLGFLLSMRLGMFGYIGMFSVLGLLPSWFWEKILRNKVKLDVEWTKKLADRLPAPIHPRREAPALHSAVEVVLGFLLLYVMAWNFSNESATPRIKIPPQREWLGQLLRLDQRWNMFSPKPLTEDGWYVVEAYQSDGGVFDLFREGDLTWDKPADVSLTYKNQRWRKYLMNLWDANNQKHRNYYAQYLCRHWNRHHHGGKQVREFKLFYMKEETLPNYEQPRVEKVLLWHHYCFDMPSALKK
ncbi:MAG: HTTM domain-containing protein [Vulcanimicrobiota bacterium]